MVNEKMTDMERITYDILGFLRSGSAKDSRAILQAMKEKGWTEKETLDGLTFCVTAGLIAL